MISQNTTFSLDKGTPVQKSRVRDRYTGADNISRIWSDVHISPLIVRGPRRERDAPQEFALRCEEIPRRIKELGEEEEWNAKRLLDEAGIPWPRLSRGNIYILATYPL